MSLWYDDFYIAPPACTHCGQKVRVKHRQWRSLEKDHGAFLCEPCDEKLTWSLKRFTPRRPDTASLVKFSLLVLAVATFVVFSAIASERTIDKTWYWQEGTAAYRDWNGTEPACDWHHDEDCDVG